MHKQQGWPQAWEYCQAKPIQTLGRASQGVNWSWSQCVTIKSHHAQTSSGKELPNHFWNRDIVRSILPGLKRKRTGLLLSGPKSSFQMKVHFQMKSLEEEWRDRIHVAWSPVWSFYSQWWFGLPCHLLVLSVHCVFWSPQSLSRGRWETPDPTMQTIWRPLSKQPGLHYTWAVPQADHLHDTPHWCSNSCKRKPNQVLSA